MDVALDGRGRVDESQLRLYDRKLPLLRSMLITALETLSLSIDVPDGLAAVHPQGVNRFTLRSFPTLQAVPEPTTATLIGLGSPAWPFGGAVAAETLRQGRAGQGLTQVNAIFSCWAGDGWPFSCNDGDMKIHIIVETSATAENLDDLNLREYLHLLMVGTMDHLWSSRVVSWKKPRRLSDGT